MFFLADSIVILGSKSIMLKALNHLLKENYFIEELVYFVNRFDINYQQLKDAITNVTPNAVNLFDKLTA